MVLLVGRGAQAPFGHAPVELSFTPANRRMTVSGATVCRAADGGACRAADTIAQVRSWPTAVGSHLAARASELQSNPTTSTMSPKYPRTCPSCCPASVCVKGDGGGCEQCRSSQSGPIFAQSRSSLLGRPAGCGRRSAAARGVRHHEKYRVRHCSDIGACLGWRVQ